MDNAETAAPAARRRGPAAWIIGAGVLVVVVGVFIFWRLGVGKIGTDDAQIDGHILPLAARIAGTVQDVHAQDNEVVAAGAVLVQIDPTDYKVALARAEAELAAATASAQGAATNVPMTATTTTGQVETAESDVATAGARVRMAQAHEKETAAKAAEAARDLDRLKGLMAKDEVSRQEYTAASTAAESARAEHDSAQAQEREAEASVRSSQAKLTTAHTGPEQVAIVRARAATAQAMVAQAQSAVERARLDLDHTSIKAPAGGIVSKKTVEVGQVVQVGQPLLAIVPLEDIWVTANFKENELRDIRPGQPVTVKVDAYGRTYKGHVDSIAAATGAKFSLLPPENATGNYVKVVQRIPVKIVFEKGEDPDHLLRPGMSVVPTVRTK
jgi:membrane fusion protein, multidrug efflux system